MTQVQERRDPKNHRVTVSTLVEVCGNVPGTPVFEAESIDLSARGMHLRTAYLPETGTPLVCRFESKGREIVVEGRVAWRRAATRGGEFGVEFTALDSRGVDALRELCRTGEERQEEDGAELGEPGSRVRLHIEGLGSPMKARVKTSRGSKLQVGSSLEFLKVGRKLELEDLEHGARRGAEIDGISVIVDPSTQVPQLIVALKFEGQESTPEPSVADVKGGSSRAEGLRIPAEAVTTSSRAKASAGQESVGKLRIKDEPASADSAKSAGSKSVEADQDAAEDADDDQPEMRGKVAVLASQAEKKAKAAGEVLARLSHGAAEGAAGWFKGAQERVLKLRSPKAPERRTTAAPKSMRASEKPKLRQQSSSKDDADVEAAPSATKSRRTLAIAACVGVVGLTALVFATRSSAPNAPRSNDPVAAANGLNPEGAPANGSAVALAPGAPRPLRDPGPPAVVTANVPLFGPTPLATTEPAPLGPVPGSDAAFIEDAEKAAAKASLRGGSNLDESFEAADETSERAIERNPSKDGKLARDAATKKPEDVSPWGHGKMHEPIVHRLRLDGPGAAINGAVEPTGFTVTIPDRKVMEPTTSITKREPRLARLRAANTGSGAQISFRFKDGVPSYRVRLRRDYVEFLISSPEEKPSKGDAEGSRKKTDKR